MVAATAAGYVLVGGRSSRFGSDKAVAEWQGGPLCIWVAEQVRAAAGSATLVGNPDKYQSLGLPVIGDGVPGAGPLGGLSSALQHSIAEWNLIVACDMPFLRTDFLQWLLREAAAGPADILLPLDRDGRDEPLCAVYSLRCRGPIAAALAQGVRKVTAAFAAMHVRRLPSAAFDPDGRLFTNWNTPAEARLHG